MELQKACLNADVAYHVSELSRVDFLPQVLCGLKRFSDLLNEMFLNEAFLHFKHLGRLLQELELLDEADISERDEPAALLVEVYSAPLEHELAIFVLDFILFFSIDHVAKHDVPLYFILITTAVILV